MLYFLEKKNCKNCHSVEGSAVTFLGFRPAGGSAPVSHVCALCAVHIVHSNTTATFYKPTVLLILLTRLYYCKKNNKMRLISA